MRRILIWFALGSLLLSAAAAMAAEPVVRIGVLKFGTANWELDVIARHRLDQAAGIRIQPVELASTPATQVALQAGKVDTIISDWLWVSRQRAAGADWTFAPFSTAVGAVMVPRDSAVKSLRDLKGLQIGVAGSPIDKSWLIMRLSAQKSFGVDLQNATTQAFGAPPLLDEQLKAGRLAAVLTYWQFAARLQAEGMRQVISVTEALRMLGLKSDIPLVGYVFSERWIRENPALFDGFLRVDRSAKQLLASSDDEWESIRPLTGAQSNDELLRLRDAFRAGIPQHWGDDERDDAARLYALLAQVGGEALVGSGPTISPGTFADADRF